MARELVLDVVARKNSKDLEALALEFDKLAASVDGSNKSSQQSVKFSKFLDDQIAETRKQVQQLTQEFNKTGSADIFGQLRGSQRNLDSLVRIRKQLGDVGEAQQETTRELEGSEKVLRGLSDEYQNLGADVRRTEQNYKDLTDRIKTQTETVRQLERESRAGGATPFNVAYYREATRSLDDLKAQAEDLKAALAAAPEDAAKKFKTFDAFVASEIAQQRGFVEALQRDLARTGNVSLLKPLKDAQSDLHALEDIKNAFGKAGEESGKSFLSGMGKAFGFGRELEGGFGSELLATLLTPQGIAGATVVASAAGVAIGGALLTGIGLAGVGAGIAGQLKSPQVVAALATFKHDLSSGFKEATNPFAGPLAAGIQILDRGFKDNLPDLEDTFKKLAPEVTTLAHGASGFLTGLVTGLEHAAVAAKPLIEDFAHFLPEFGRNLGGIFDEMAAHEKEAAEGLHLIEDFLNGVAIAGQKSIPVFSEIFDVAKWANTEFEVKKLIKLFTGADLDAAGSAGSLGRQLADVFRDEGQAAGSAATALGKLNQALDDNIQKQLDTANAALGAKQSFIDLSDSIKQNGRDWSDNTAAGIANQRALLNAIAAQEAKRQSDVASGKDAVAAAAEYDKQVDSLLAIAQNAGDSKAALDALKGHYEIDIDEVRRQYFINEGNADPSQFHHGLAGGGPVSAGRTYLVGENGPELFMSNTSGQIISNDKLRNLSSLSSPPPNFRTSSAAASGTTVTFAGDTDGAFATAFQMLVRTGAIRIS